MALNKSQRSVLTVGCLVIVAMLLYPPWASGYATGSRLAWGYRYDSLFSPPDFASPRWVDWSVLTAQCLVVAVLTGLSLLLLGGRKAEEP